MRLINTSSFDILVFNPPNIPRYAILSHTWTDDEFVFSDINDLDRRDSKGFQKISGCCALAAAEGWQFLWVDTCCIDKSSSAELSEAINSMYKWYEKSEICYVYLEDFSLKNRGEELEQSRWFSRGWTLQELLAPRSVVFYDQNWVEIGSKRFLKAKISSICGISPEHLDEPKNASIATKMSWASRRYTSREEDMAYSLLGLFNINMPLLYGEGDNAFYRLQCEIIQSSTDESIFAWKDSRYRQSGLLAKSPSAFTESNDIVPIYAKALSRPPYYITNKGLAIEFVVCTIWNRRQFDPFDGDYCQASFACARTRYKDTPVMLTLATFDGPIGRFSKRVDCGLLEFDTKKTFLNRRSERLTFYISEKDNWNLPVAQPRVMWFTLMVKLTSAQSGLVSVEDYSEPRRDFSYNEEGSIISSLQVKKSKQFALKFTSSEGNSFFLASCVPALSQDSVYFFDMGRDWYVGNAKGSHRAFFNNLFESSLKKVALGSTDNLSWQLAPRKFLWIKTRREYTKHPEDNEERARRVVEVDVTTVDRSMLI
ncbi:MAG: hypothetical protein Q9195_008063 [Heterodermia aff. obscurata]